jgi:mannose-6-phosphate isomerase-like protein (cupin superfamily)
MRQKPNRKLFKLSKLGVNLKSVAKHNRFFRNVVYTDRSIQIVVARIPPGGEIGCDEARHNDLVLFIVSGSGRLILDSKERALERHDLVFVSAKSPGKLKNVGQHDLKLLAIYAPPQYLDGTIRKTQQDAMAAAREAMQHAWEQ